MLTYIEEKLNFCTLCNVYCALCTGSSHQNFTLKICYKINAQKKPKIVVLRFLSLDDASVTALITFVLE